MTENEAISGLETLKYQCKYNGECGTCNICYSAVPLAIQALEEIQQYRELGTVEEILKVFNNQRTIIATQHETVKQYRAIGTIKELINTQIREKVLNVELECYKEIGTIEEFKALKEKNTPQELAEHNFQDEVHHYLCPSCRSIVSCNQNYCEECGQALQN